MKKSLKLLIIALAFTACKNESKKAELVENKTTTWIDSFKEFRTAVYQDDLSKIKSFIDFPMVGTNEIWYLTSTENDVYNDTDDIKPFTEKDFDKNPHKIFTKPFINSILKIKTEILYKTGEFETIFIKNGETDYKVFANFDKKANQLVLSLYSETLIKEMNEREEFEEKAEYSIIYYFDIIKNNHLKFRYIRIAG